MTLYTRKGDDGQTGLGSGEQVDKDHIRVAAYGDVDELNAAVGLALAACDDAALTDKLARVQDRLFVLGAELADPERSEATPALEAADVTRLEAWIDEAAAAAGPLKGFVLPGGCELAARLHQARTICRRAERLLVTLSRHQEVGPAVMPFVNRLSDLLFAWSRLANRLAGVEDTVWHPPPGSGNSDESAS